ncbi:cohesin domain-containing protein [Microbacterium enclense]|uniref:cohesin domain-containing protein n=1 Tax=Microbacterium enclense TaxID=993073 RepID=UPI0034418FE7
MRRFGAALVAGFALLGPLCVAPAAHAAPPAAVLTVDVASTTAAVGDTVVVTVSGSGVSDLYAYDLVLSADDLLLEPTGDAPTGPEGGFTSAVAAPGEVTITHTRLGTSPGLSSTGRIVLTSVPVRVLAVGTARIKLSAARLVSSTGEVTTSAAGASATLSLTAVPAPTPSPTATATPTPTPTPTATPAPTASASPSPTGSAAAGSGGSALATTGADAAAWLTSGVVGVVLLAAGGLLVARRRQGVRE